MHIPTRRFLFRRCSEKNIIVWYWLTPLFCWNISQTSDYIWNHWLTDGVLVHCSILEDMIAKQCNAFPSIARRSRQSMKIVKPPQHNILWFPDLLASSRIQQQDAARPKYNHKECSVYLWKLKVYCHCVTHEVLLHMHQLHSIASITSLIPWSISCLLQGWCNMEVRQGGIWMHLSFTTTRGWASPRLGHSFGQDSSPSLRAREESLKRSSSGSWSLGEVIVPFCLGDSNSMWKYVERPDATVLRNPCEATIKPSFSSNAVILDWKVVACVHASSVRASRRRSCKPGYST